MTVYCLHTFQPAISCNLYISHLTITTDSMISTLFPGSIHPLRFKEGNSASPRPKGGPWTNKTSTFSGMAFGAITGQMQLLILVQVKYVCQIGTLPQVGVRIQEHWKPPPRHPAKFCIPVSATWIDQKPSSYKRLPYLQALQRRSFWRIESGEQ